MDILGMSDRHTLVTVTPMMATVILPEFWGTGARMHGIIIAVVINIITGSKRKENVMNKHIISAIGLSGFLLLGTAPGVVLAHEGHDHGTHSRSDYSSYDEEEEAGRYAPSRENDRRNEDAYDEEEEDDSYRSSARRYSPPEREQSTPREQRSRTR
jgi:hypothetical protein